MSAADIMTDDDRWAAVLRRDRALDGRFVTGVLTTGIYCRPSCAARHPLRENVRFFADGAAARATGLRPCNRCLPDAVARHERAVLAALGASQQRESASGRAGVGEYVSISGVAVSFKNTVSADLRRNHNT